MSEMLETSLRDVIRPGSKRGLDFVIVDELRKRTGINPESVLKFALSEMLCNALDTDATEVNIRINMEYPSFCHLEVEDNGSQKLSRKDVEMILDFESKASSKRGFLMVSRGYLGNALKCIFGYSYALAELKGQAAPSIIVKSGELEHRISLKPDKINDVIKSEIETTKREDDGLTTFIVKFPLDYVTNPSGAKILEDIIIATSMVNPTRKITYDMGEYAPGHGGTLESQGKAKPIRKETSVLWYNKNQFQNLWKDFLRVRPQTPLKEFVALFRGFTSKKVIREILQKLNTHNHDSEGDNVVQFFPATPISNLPEQMVSSLLGIMKAMAKPIPRNKRTIAAVLGSVGEESLEILCKQRGWERLRYISMPGIRVECPEWKHDDHPCLNLDHVEFPYLVELAVFDRNNDGEGLKVYQCVNFMASMEDIFARIFDISFRLGRVGITKETPVTVVAHFVCPVLKWLNYGKSGLDE
jgi:hypothetical protein